MEAFYALSKVLAMMSSLATMAVLVVLGHPRWAIYPAILAFLATMSVLVGFNIDKNSPEDRD